MQADDKILLFRLYSDDSDPLVTKVCLKTCSNGIFRNFSSFSSFYYNKGNIQCLHLKTFRTNDKCSGFLQIFFAKVPTKICW